MDSGIVETTVTEVVEIIDYTPILLEISTEAALSADFLQIVTGCLVFLVVVLLCYFVYKFFRIFF